MEELQREHGSAPGMKEELPTLLKDMADKGLLIED